MLNEKGHSRLGMDISVLEEPAELTGQMLIGAEVAGAEGVVENNSAPSAL
jgi:hypothetical protein